MEKRKNSEFSCLNFNALFTSEHLAHRCHIGICPLTRLGSAEGYRCPWHLECKKVTPADWDDFKEYTDANIVGYYLTRNYIE